MEHFDVLIIGAGLSGIGAGAHLRMECPAKSFAVLEAREAMGGTWDLFRYPGIRSDSDMYTLGYRFRPWNDPKAIADGPAILKYIRETAEEFDLNKTIRYGHRVTRAEWSTETATWTVTASVSSPAAKEGQGNGSSHGSTKKFTCNFLYLCTGYYDYDSGYTPDFKDSDKFRGPVVHPQKWPEDLDYSGKRIIVIGSGATAVTLVPAMARKAEHVTMLQRSPTYIVARPSKDVIANFLRRVLPSRAAYMLTRWKNVLFGMFFYGLSRKRPETMKRIIAKGVRKQLGDDLDPADFTPPYNPWDQRLCLVPDADLFRSMKEGRTSIVTGEVEKFTETGIRLRSGQHLVADIIVTATGLSLKIFAGMQLVVDGEAVSLPKKFVYKGMMFSDLPNLVFAIGYTNASWTLKCDLTAQYTCRLLNYMDAHGYASSTPRVKDREIEPIPVIDFNSGYVLRALDSLPRQGSKTPWRLHQNYLRDLLLLRFGTLNDGSMEFKSLNESRISASSAVGAAAPPVNR